MNTPSSPAPGPRSARAAAENFDPYGILLEVACWHRALDDADARIAPAAAAATG